MTYTEMMQDLVNKDYDSLLRLAKAAMADVYPLCKKVDTDNDGFFMFTSIVLSAIGADGTLTGIERKFLRDLLGLSDTQISDLIKMYDSRMVELTDKFVDALSSDQKAQVVLLVCTIAASDEKISREENAFIKKLLA